jgi:hypothetical protein
VSAAPVVAKRHADKPKRTDKKTPPAESQSLPPAAQVQPLPAPVAPAQDAPPAAAVARASADAPAPAAESRSHKDKQAKPAKANKPRKEAKQESKPASDDPFEAAIERAKGMNAGDIHAKIK